MREEKVVLVDRWIGQLEGLKNKAWSSAALVKAKDKQDLRFFVRQGIKA